MDPLKLPGHNSTSYPLAVKGQLDQLEYTKEIAKKLRLNQYVPKEFFTRAPGVRGLLVYAGMGQGKTRLATAVAEESRALDPKRRVIILLAKSIEGNFAKTVEGFSEKDAKDVKANYRFVSLNAGNMIKTMSSVDKSEEELKYEKRLGEFMKNVSRGVALENSLLVVDEAHNLFNGITNGSKNALGLYDLIMKTRNIKLLFLTGTPVINNPFELVPCFNMARGPIRLRSGGNEYTEALTRPETFMGGASGADEKTTGGFGERKGPEDLSKGTTRLFSENYDEFANFFVDKENRTIKNKEKFANRIFGLTSYYGDLYFEAGNKPGFPKELPTIVERVPMGEAQFTAYLEAREGEREENSKGFKGQNSRFRAMQGGSSTYRVKSRQISNYRIPDYALGPARGRKARQKFIGRLKIADLHELGSLSPKMARVLLNINKHQGQPGLVYSQFVSGEGIGIFQRVLEAHNYVSYDQVDGGKAFGLKNKVQGRFAVLSGAISVEQREAIITLYNSKANADGSKIALLLLSGAVAEGIDLKRTRHVHVMEPFWNFARIEQVKTRAVRFESHVDLPKAQQNVQTYIYLSDYPAGYSKKKIVEPTTDVDLYERSLVNMEIINSFLQVLAETSMDCAVHWPTLPKSVQAKIKCKMCSPTGAPLYHPLLHRDMALPSNCEPYAETKLKAREILVPQSQEKFYYRIDRGDGPPLVQLYAFDEALQGYTEMSRSHPVYAHVIEAVFAHEKITA
jgi:hypothetical protein